MQWFVRFSLTPGGADEVVTFGELGDVPLKWEYRTPSGSGSYPIVYRAGVFVFPGGCCNPNVEFGFGNRGDVPVAGDWNGDRLGDFGVFRDGVFYLEDYWYPSYSPTHRDGVADLTVAYGNPGDVPIVGDWNGDGMDTVGVYRNGVFYLRNSNTGGVADQVFAYGNPGDIPLPVMWHPGWPVASEQIAVIRPSQP